MDHQCLVCKDTGLVELPREEDEVVGFGLYGPRKTRPCSCRRGSYGPDISWAEFDKERGMRRKLAALIKRTHVVLELHEQFGNVPKPEWDHLAVKLQEVEDAL